LADVIFEKIITTVEPGIIHSMANRIQQEEFFFQVHHQDCNYRNLDQCNGDDPHVCAHQRVSNYNQRKGI